MGSPVMSLCLLKPWRRSPAQRTAMTTSLQPCPMTCMDPCRHHVSGLQKHFSRVLTPASLSGVSMFDITGLQYSAVSLHTKPTLQDVGCPGIAEDQRRHSACMHAQGRRACGRGPKQKLPCLQYLHHDEHPGEQTLSPIHTARCACAASARAPAAARPSQRRRAGCRPQRRGACRCCCTPDQATVV